MDDQDMAHQTDEFQEAFMQLWHTIDCGYIDVIGCDCGQDTIRSITDKGRAALEAYQADVRLHKKLSAIGSCGCGWEFDEAPLCDKCQSVADTLSISENNVITERQLRTDVDVRFAEWMFDAGFRLAATTRSLQRDLEGNFLAAIAAWKAKRAE